MSGSTTSTAFRSAFLGLFVATGAAMLGFGIIEPIMPLYAETLGASGVGLGLIAAGFAVTRGIFAPIVGHVSDKYGRKRLLLVGLGLYVLLSGAYVLAGAVVTLVAIRLGQGLASVMVTPIAQSYVGDITPRGKEGTYMNLFTMSLFGGMAVGPSVGGFLSDVYSLHAPFYALGGVALLAFVIVAVTVPREQSSDDGPDGLSLRGSMSEVFADRTMRGILAYVGSRGFYRWGFNSFFPVFAVGLAALTRTQVGFILSGYMLIAGVLQYPMGRLADRYSPYRAHFVVLGGTLAALSMLLVTTVRSFVALLVLAACMGGFSSISRAPVIAIRTDRGRVHGMGAVTGSFTMSMSAGQIVGPLVFGIIVDAVSIQAAFVVGGLVGLVGTAVAFAYLREGPVEDAAQGVAADD